MVHVASDIAQHGARSGLARLDVAVLVDVAGKPPELRALTPRVITDAVPAGSRRTWDQHTWLRAVHEWVADQGFRADRARHCLLYARRMALVMDWHTRLSLPGNDVLAAEIGCTERTVTRITRLFKDAGLLGVVREGTTERLCKVGRPRPPDAIYSAVLRKTRSHERARRAAMPHALAGTGNQRPVYVLAVPRRRCPRRGRFADRPLNVYLTQPKDGVDLPPRAREAKPKPGKARAARGQSYQPRAGAAWPLGDRPQNRGEGMLAACRLQDHFPVLRRMSAKHVRHVIWPLTRHGYTPADILHAIDYDRSGVQRMLGNPDHACHVPRWLRWRLAHSIEWADDTARANWIRNGGDPPGEILASRSQQLDQAAAFRQARQDRERAERAEREHNRAPASDQERYAAIAREQLAAALAKPPPAMPATAPPPAQSRPEVNALLRLIGGSHSAELLHHREAAPENPAGEPP